MLCSIFQQLINLVHLFNFTGSFCIPPFFTVLTCLKCRCLQRVLPTISLSKKTALRACVFWRWCLLEACCCSTFRKVCKPFCSFLFKFYRLFQLFSTTIPSSSINLQTSANNYAAMQAFSKNQTRFSEQTRRANLSERVATTAPNIRWANLTR